MTVTTFQIEYDIFVMYISQKEREEEFGASYFKYDQFTVLCSCVVSFGLSKCEQISN